MSDEGRRVPEADPRVARRPWVITYPVRLWIVCQELCVVIVHWTGQRTQRCRIDAGEEECPSCKDGHPRMLQNWLLAQDQWVRHKPALLHLTPHAVEKCAGFAHHAGDLWGRLLLVQRRPARPTGKMWARIEHTSDIPPLTEPRPVLPHLERLWAAPLFAERPHNRTV